MGVYDDVKQALQDVVAPQLAEFRGEMQERFAQMDARITSLRAEMEIRFAQVDKRFAGLEAELRAQGTELRQEINNLHTDVLRIEQVFDAKLQTVQMTERVARLEERAARP